MGDASDCTEPDNDDPPAPPPGGGTLFASLRRPQNAPGEINLDNDPPASAAGASVHAAPKSPPAQPPAPPAPETPPPDIVLQVGENTVLYQIPGANDEDINITWTFEPTGDLETDLAEQRRVGRLAGRIVRQLPPPNTTNLRERLQHRLNVVAAAERYGFRWENRVEVRVIKAPFPGMPPTLDPEAVSYTHLTLPTKRIV